MTAHHLAYTDHEPIDDVVVIYPAACPSGPRRWVSHALRTDLICYGETHIDALAAAFAAMEDLEAACKACPGIRREQPAPDDITAKAQLAEEMNPALIHLARELAAGKTWEELMLRPIQSIEKTFRASAHLAQ